MRNNFDKSIYYFWMDNRVCWWCGLEVMKGERVDALHHILGRKSNSILNSAPIHNFHCHLGNGKINKPETIKDFLNKTYSYVINNGYKLNKKDEEFIHSNINYYEGRKMPKI